jgi:cobalt-zinc-cadmium efflux system membrane fusion protein
MKAATAGVLLLLISACKGEKHEHAEESPAPSGSAHADGHEHHEELPRTVRLTDAVARDAKIQVAPATREALAATLNLPGEIAADPDRLARIASPAAGRIDAVRIREGAEVKKGAALIVVRLPEVGRVRASMAAVEARAKAARANAGRLGILLEKRLTSEQEALDADAAADALELEARALREQLGALGAGAAGALSVTLRAPIAGTVISREAILGQPVTPDETLATIAALDEVWFLGRVFEKDLGRLRVGSRAEIHLNAYPDEHFPGTVEYLGQKVDPSARTVTARIRMTNREGLLRIGLFGTAQIALADGATNPARIVVPRAAVTEVAGKPVVFVREPDGAFSLHDVTLGQEAPGKVEVLAGLGEGEAVVVDGVFTLKSVVLRSSFAEHGH